jgi:kynurenine aminotransferase
LISKILEEFPDIIVISDEVYNFLTFDDKQHVCFATLDNNWWKTISIYSGGKLFNATGWKIGWSIGPKPLIYMGGVIQNTVNYCLNTPGQFAMSNSLERCW